MHSGPCCFWLLQPNIAPTEDHLALEVGGINTIAVNDPNGPDTGGGEVLDDRRTEPAGADHENSGIPNQGLTVRTESIEPKVAVIPILQPIVDLDHRTTL
jgi:hypothetical protein